MYKCLYIFMLLCLSVFPVHAAKIDKCELDSFLHILNSIPQGNPSRMTTIVDMARSRQESEDFPFYFNLLYEEAKSQHDDQMLCRAIYFGVVYFYNHSDIHNVEKYIKLMHRIALREKMYYEYFNSRRFLVELYTHDNNFEHSFNEAHSMKEEALKLKSKEGIICSSLSLASVYMGTGRNELAAKELEIAVALCPEDNLVSSIEIGVQLLSVYNELKDMDALWSALQYVESTLKRIEAAHPGSKRGYNDVYLYKEIQYFNYYSYKKDLVHAEMHKNSASHYLNENTFFMYKNLYHNMLSNYYYAVKDYPNALYENGLVLEGLKENFPSDYYTFMARRADMLLEIGNSKQALRLYERLLPASDSVNQTVLQMQEERLQDDYSLKRAELRSAKNHTKIWSILLVACLLLFVIAAFFVVKLLRIRFSLKRTKADTLVALQKTESANRAKSDFLKNISYEIRSQLNSIVGFSDLLTEDKTINPAQVHDFTQIISNNSETLMNLVNGILDMSRLEAGMMRFNEMDGDVVRLVQRAVQEASASFEDPAMLHFHTDMKSRMIHTDCTQFTQMLVSIMKPAQDAESHPMSLDMSYDDKLNQVRLHFCGSSLASFADADNLDGMRNKINEMLMQHFNGVYLIDENKEITILYPALS